MARFPAEMLAPVCFLLATATLLLMMNAGGQAQGAGGGAAAQRSIVSNVRDPPAWGSGEESRYPFRDWLEDLLV